MRRSERRELFEKIKEAAGIMGVKALAMELEKPYGTLINEMNPDDASHKLGLETFIELLDILGPQLSQETLDWIAGRYGFALISLKAGESENLSRLLHKLDKEVGDISNAFLRATDPHSKAGDRISEDERKEIAREAREAVSIIQQIHSVLE